MGACQSHEDPCVAGGRPASPRRQRGSATEAFAGQCAMPYLAESPSDDRNADACSSQYGHALERAMIMAAIDDRSSSIGSVVSEPGKLRVRVRELALLASATLNGVDGSVTEVDAADTRAWLRSREVCRSNAAVREWADATLARDRAATRDSYSDAGSAAAFLASHADDSANASTVLPGSILLFSDDGADSHSRSCNGALPLPVPLPPLTAEALRANSRALDNAAACSRRVSRGSSKAPAHSPARTLQLQLES